MVAPSGSKASDILQHGGQFQGVARAGRVRSENAGFLQPVVHLQREPDYVPGVHDAGSAKGNERLCAR